jgi:predicted membrane-bound dolichyl-phosphate-mannose-protein mannosyltransferase
MIYETINLGKYLGLALINIKTIYINRLPLIFNRKSARKWIFLSKNLVFLVVILGNNRSYYGVKLLPVASCLLPNLTKRLFQQTLFILSRWTKLFIYLLFNYIPLASCLLPFA